jgi:hypothetical protein
LSEKILTHDVVRGLVKAYEAGCDEGLTAAQHDSLADSIDRLERLVLDPESTVTLDDLPPHLQQAFSRALATGEVGHLVSAWTPFWSGLEGSAPCPLSLLSSIQSPPPAPALQAASPVIVLDMTGMLLAYSVAMRTFNGEPKDHREEAQALLSVISPVLAGEQTLPDLEHESLSNCIHQHLERMVRASLTMGCGGMEAAASAVQDLAQIASMKRYVEASLSDLHALTSKKRVQKKLEFFLAWFHQWPEKDWLGWYLSIKEFQQDLQSTKSTKRPTNPTTAGPKLIQEQKS